MKLKHAGFSENLWYLVKPIMYQPPVMYQPTAIMYMKIKLNSLRLAGQYVCMCVYTMGINYCPCEV